MKRSALTTLLLTFVLARLPVAAQEHVDVPLPPYDPPPPVSHHSETHFCSTSARFSADSFTAQALWVDSFTAQSAQRQTLPPQPAPSSTSCSASTSQLLPLALGTSQMISLDGYRPSEGKFRSGNNILQSPRRTILEGHNGNSARRTGGCDKRPPGKTLVRIEGISSSPARRR